MDHVPTPPSPSGALQPWIRALVENRGYVKPPPVETSAPRPLRNRAHLKARAEPSYWELYGKQDATTAMRLLQTNLTRRACARMIKLLPHPTATAAAVTTELEERGVDAEERLSARYTAYAARLLAHDLELRATGGEGLPPAVVASARGDPSTWLADEGEVDLTVPDAAPPPKRARPSSSQDDGDDDEEEEEEEEDGDDDEEEEEEEEDGDDGDDESEWNEDEANDAGDEEDADSEGGVGYDASSEDEPATPSQTVEEHKADDDSKEGECDSL